MRDVGQRAGRMAPRAGNVQSRRTIAQSPSAHVPTIEPIPSQVISTGESSQSAWPKTPIQNPEHSGQSASAIHARDNGS